MDSNISDCKFWVQKYTAAFKSHEATMVQADTDVKSMMDRAMEEMKKKISIKDMALNFKALNDLMFTKF
jgi:predicted metal-dependent peptidase